MRRGCLSCSFLDDEPGKCLAGTERLEVRDSAEWKRSGNAGSIEPGPDARFHARDRKTPIRHAPLHGPPAKLLVLPSSVFSSPAALVEPASIDYRGTKRLENDDATGRTTKWQRQMNAIGGMKAARRRAPRSIVISNIKGAA